MVPILDLIFFLWNLLFFYTKVAKVLVCVAVNQHSLNFFLLIFGLLATINIYSHARAYRLAGKNEVGGLQKII